MPDLFVNELSRFALSLSEQGQRLFSDPLYWVLLANGDADFHDNVIFFGFDGHQNDPALVVKVPRLAENGWMLKTESDRLTEIWGCLGQEAMNYVPKPYAMTVLQGRPVLILSHIPGESLTRLSPRSFWRNRDQVSALAKEAAGSLRDLNRLTETPLGPEELLGSPFQKKADTFRGLFPVTPAEDQALFDLAQRVRDSESAATHKVLTQGDFWHGNMIRDQKRGRLMFIDWQFARWSVDVSLDVYFFLLAAALAATGGGPVEARARDAFRILKDWRADVIPEYLAAYGKPDRYVLLPQKSGLLLCCLEKAVRSGLEFGYSHPDDLMWRHLFAELLQWSDDNWPGSRGSNLERAEPTRAQI